MPYGTVAEYLRINDAAREGEAAMRYLEMRIGELAGDAVIGGDRRSEAWSEDVEGSQVCEPFGAVLVPVNRRSRRRNATLACGDTGHTTGPSSTTSARRTSRVVVPRQRSTPAGIVNRNDAPLIAPDRKPSRTRCGAGTSNSRARKKNPVLSSAACSSSAIGADPTAGSWPWEICTIGERARSDAANAPGRTISSYVPSASVTR